MAKITFKGQSEYYKKLQQLQKIYQKDGPLKRVVYKGADVVADAIRSKIGSLPVTGFQRLPEGKRFSGISKEQKEDLLKGFGLSKIKRENGYVNTKAGFDGYGSYPTKSYPSGLPNSMLARSVESGSSVRAKYPFVAPAVRASKDEAVREMENEIDTQMKDIFEGG